jgi:hypothetical protein
MSGALLRKLAEGLGSSLHFEVDGEAAAAAAVASRFNNEVGGFNYSFDVQIQHEIHLFRKIYFDHT